MNIQRACILLSFPDDSLVCLVNSHVLTGRLELVYVGLVLYFVRVYLWKVQSASRALHFGETSFPNCLPWKSCHGLARLSGWIWSRSHFRVREGPLFHRCRLWGLSGMPAEVSS